MTDSAGLAEPRMGCKSCCCLCVPWVIHSGFPWGRLSGALAPAGKAEAGDAELRGGGPPQKVRTWCSVSTFL